MKKIGTLALNTVYTFIVMVVLAVALLFVGTKVNLLGYEVKVVMSGSMEPTIHTGGIVIIAPSATYGIGDIITFGKDTARNIPVTHRIVEVSGEGRSAAYSTKGDANEEKDGNAVRGHEVIGKVAFSIPYLGYVIAFARTPLGFLTLIGIPAMFIILDEFANIVWEVRVYLARKKRSEGTMRTHNNIGAKNKRQRMRSAQVTGSAKEDLTPLLKLHKSFTHYDLDLKNNSLKHSS